MHTPEASGMKLEDVYASVELSAPILLALLAERPRANWISHGALPSMKDHRAFIASKPFRYWYLIDAGSRRVGAIEVTNSNEIGIAVLEEHQRKGHAREALTMFLQTHKPLPPIPAIRNGRWLANIATRNEKSKDFFWHAGFRPLQETWAL